VAISLLVRELEVNGSDGANIKAGGGSKNNELLLGNSSSMGQVTVNHIKDLVGSKLVAPKHAFISVVAFRFSTKEAKIYALKISECFDVVDTTSFLGTSIPVEYHDLHEVFSEKASNELPSHGISDMKIELKEGQEPRSIGLQPMSLVELEELRKYLEENLEKRWIQRSTSPVSTPIVFIQKKDGSIRVCVVYRNLNKVIVRNCYPLPLISELTDQLVGATIFTKLDIRQAYHCIHMALGHEYKTAFKTWYGLFEYLVMPFGLTNALMQFQSHM